MAGAVACRSNAYAVCTLAAQAVGNRRCITGEAYSTAVQFRVGFTAAFGRMVIGRAKALSRIRIAIRTRGTHGVEVAAMIVAVIFTSVVVQVVLCLAICGNTTTIHAILCGTVGHRIAVALCIIISAMLRTVQFAFVIIQIRNTGVT